MNKNFTTSPLNNREVIESATFDYKSWRARFILVVLRIASLLGIAMVIVSFPSATEQNRIFFAILYIILLSVTFLPSPYWLRANTLLSLSFIIGLNALLTWGVRADATLFFLSFVSMAALLFDKRVDIFALVLCLLTILAVAILTTVGLYKLSSPAVPTISNIDWIIFELDFAALGIILVSAINLFKREFVRVTDQMRITFNALLIERAQLEDRVHLRTQELEQKTTQLRSSTSIARTVAELHDVNELMDAIVHQVTDQFGYYHVGLYLLDEKKKIAFLQAASSPTGKDLLAKGFRLDVDQRNAINQVVEQNKSSISSQTTNSARFKDESFPLTRSRMILPLAVRGTVIGVLDLHSERLQAFDLADAEILQPLADLIAVSIDNVHLLDETRALVSQLETFTSYQTQEAWHNFSKRQNPAYQYTPAGVRPVYPSSTKEDDGRRLKIPLTLREQTIGFITLRKRDNVTEWTDRERALLEKIAAQVALALDNSRLVEEAQKNARRDQIITNISTRVRETLDVDAVVRTAAIELRRIFDLKEAEISVGSVTPKNVQTIAPSKKSSNANSQNQLN